MPFFINVKDILIIQRDISLNQWYFESYESSTDSYKKDCKKVYTNWINTRWKEQYIYLKKDEKVRKQY